MTTPAVSGFDFRALTPTQGGAQKSASEASEDRFLTLLVTQLKNQDPLNPMDNAEMTTQLAQISTVGGIDKLNTTLQSLLAAYGATQSMQATSLMGQGVLVPGHALNLQNGVAAGGVTLDGAADRVVVSIIDKSGVLRQELDLGAQPAGTVNFAWDGATANGRAKDGAYTFKVAAVRGDANVTATPLAYGRVTAVSPSASGATLTVDGVGSVAMADVKQIVQ